MVATKNHDVGSRQLSERFLERQARLGITPNPIALVLPEPQHREVWTRWPKLRSARRPSRVESGSPNASAESDAVLNGDRLSAFSKEMRDAPCASPQTASGHVSAPDLAPATLGHAFHIIEVTISGHRGIYMIAACLGCVVSLFLFLS